MVVRPAGEPDEGAEVEDVIAPEQVSDGRARMQANTAVPVPASRPFSGVAEIAACRGLPT